MWPFNCLVQGNCGCVDRKEEALRKQAALGAAIAICAIGLSARQGATEPASTNGFVVLDLELTVDAVTRATPGLGKGIKPPHLRPEIKRPPFMVPPELENLALYKPVSASEAEAVIGDVDQLTDDLKKSGDFDYVEFGHGLQWVQVDLDEPQTIHAIVFWHFYKNAVIYNDVIVQVADDPAFETNIRTLFNNDHDNSSGLGKGADTAYATRWWGEIVDARGEDFKGTVARYIRIYTATGMENEPPRFVEIAVYGN
jgi:hypothetical protein